jgi:hypothetical protein
MQKVIGKGLEAIGIASLAIAVIHGIASGDMWGELYFFVGGMAVFYVGRWIEQRGVKT